MSFFLRTTHFGIWGSTDRLETNFFGFPISKNGLSQIFSPFVPFFTIFRSTIHKIAKSDPSTIFSIKVANQLQITGNFFLSSKTILEMFWSYLGVKKYIPWWPPQEPHFGMFWALEFMLLISEPFISSFFDFLIYLDVVYDKTL